MITIVEAQGRRAHYMTQECTASKVNLDDCRYDALQAMLSALYCHDYNSTSSYKEAIGPEVEVAALAQRFLVPGLDMNIAHTVAGCMKNFEQHDLTSSFSQIVSIYANLTDTNAKAKLLEALNEHIHDILSKDKNDSVLNDCPELAVGLLKSRINLRKIHCKNCGSYTDIKHSNEFNLFGPRPA